MELLSYRNNHSVESMAFKALTAGINQKKRSKECESQGGYKVKAAGGRKLSDGGGGTKEKTHQGLLTSITFLEYLVCSYLLTANFYLTTYN